MTFIQRTANANQRRHFEYFDEKKILKPRVRIEIKDKSPFSFSLAVRTSLEKGSFRKIRYTIPKTLDDNAIHPHHRVEITA